MNGRASFYCARFGCTVESVLAVLLFLTRLANAVIVAPKRTAAVLDAESLLQVQHEHLLDRAKTATSAGAPPIGTPYYTKRTPDDTETFPDIINNRKIVGQLCRTYLGWHLFTVGLYLDTTSPAWDRSYNSSNLNDLLESSVGHFATRYKLTNRITKQAFRKYVIKPMNAFNKDPKRDDIMTNFSRIFSKGPPFHEEAVLDFVSGPSGLQFFFDNVPIEIIGNQNLSKANLGWFISEGAPIEEFREMLIKNLRFGATVDVQKIWAGSSSDNISARVIAIIVIGAFIVAGLLFLSCWFVWRRFRRASHPVPAPPGAKRAGPARFGARGSPGAPKAQVAFSKK